MNEQEKFWSGEDGISYIQRNGEWMKFRDRLWEEVVEITGEIQSVIEFGPNIGHNLLALRKINPECHIAGVDINVEAFKKLKEIGVDAYNESILTFNRHHKYQLSFTCNVLIHISPDDLKKAYENLWNCSYRYILISEYYNPTPVEVKYRGRNNLLWKRDFAGELMKLFPIKLLRYGFYYHLDEDIKGNDTTWFLMEKLA